MKTLTIKFYSLILISLLFSCTNSKNKTTDELGTNVFNAIKMKDKEKLKSFFITKEQIFEVINNTSWPDEVKKDKTEFMNAKWGSEFEESYESIYGSFFRHDVNPQYLIMDYIKLENHSTIDSLEQADIDIYVHTDKNKYQLHLDDCINTKDGWLISSYINVTDQF